MTSDERWKARGWRRLNHFFVSGFREARDFGATISLTCVSDRQSVFVNPLDPLQACKWCHCRSCGQIVRFYWNWIVQDRRSDWSRLFRLESVSKKPKLTGATNYTPNKVFQPIWACWVTSLHTEAPSINISNLCLRKLLPSEKLRFYSG